MAARIKAERAHSPKECEESWSLIYDWTLKVRQVWPSIWTVPIVEGPVELVTAAAKSPGTLLDVGASNSSPLRAALAGPKAAIRYHSFDIDRRTQQDFYSWAEVQQQFDTAACFEVMEHLPVSVGLELCGQVFQHLQPGGVFVVGTPNIFHPTRYLQDPTHITPWAYDRLAGALLALGFDISGIHRLRDFTPAGGSLRARLAQKLAAKLRPHLGLDFANSIYVVAQRPA